MPTDNEKIIQSQSANPENGTAFDHARKTLLVLDGVLTRSNALQQSLLENQSQAFEAIRQLESLSSTDPGVGGHAHPLFSRSQLEEFALGSIARCFGPEYAILDERKTPRIPNGRLLLIDSVSQISGSRKVLAPPAAITTEYFVRSDAWFFQQKSYPGLPLAVLMEIALQPCGILSAYLGTSLVIPAENNLFRNLDGAIRFGNIPALQDKTIRNKASLIKSISSAGLFIQEFSFDLSVDGATFLSGESSFGYFTQSVMERQTGLDISEKRPKLVIGNRTFGESVQESIKDAVKLENAYHAGGLLDLVDEIWFSAGSGKYGQGVVIGQKKLSGNEWFFENHFFQDPVMPGSLGLEAIVTCLWAYANQLSEGLCLDPASFEFPATQPMVWKYRGQVLPVNPKTYFEVHIKERLGHDGHIQFLADADFWVGDVRIYSVEDIAMKFKESRI